MKIKNIFTYANLIIPVLIAVGLFLGGVLHGWSDKNLDQKVWFITLLIGLVPLIYGIAKQIVQRKIGVDAIAIVAIVTAVLTQQYLAGVVILLMFSGGKALESFAQLRAKQELTQLLNSAPIIAHIKQADNNILDLHVTEVKIGDILVIKAGEVVPVDGVVVSGISNVDESVITGESLPVEKQKASMVFSGSINQEHALEIKAVRTSKDSKYQTIVQLVQEAQNVQAPVVRLADRYALFFNGITLLLAVVTWIIFQDPIRVLAVLVVASPCPLILATPIAMLSGISKAAARGIIVKSGAALEKLGRVRGLVFDKTGTLTLGSPEVVEVVTVSSLSRQEILQIAASLDQLSVHILARSLIQYAQQNILKLDYPENFEEIFGQGVRATIKNQSYFFGKIKYIISQKIAVASEIVKAHETFQQEGKMIVYLSNETDLLGYVIFSDRLRPETSQMFDLIRKHDVADMIMLTGDKKSVAETIAQSLGINKYYADLLPEKKAELIKVIQDAHGPVAMVGDGINDAPAMAASSVGIAIASHGATAASEASDVVIMVNDMHKVHDILHIAQRTMKIAKQGIFVGMGVSIALMMLALLGFITPVLGAIMQEVLDVIVIINALRLTFEKIE